MKPRSNSVRLLPDMFNLCLALAGATIGPAALGSAYTWDGGDNTSVNWSTPANWSTDVAPAATGDTLTFAGTNNLNANNNLVTSLATSGTAVTFASSAGSFNLSGNTITMGSGGGGGQIIIQQNSANNQTISANINLSGGNGDRSIVFGSGAGSLTLSGNINFSNDWLFPTTTAGTLVLSGNNSGDGKGTNAITAGTNIMRAMMRNNVAGTQLVLGSDTALGNSGTGSAAAGTASFRGILANAQLNISTTGGNRDLSGSSLIINTNNITFNGTNNLKIGNIINQGGNRDFVASSSGTVTVSSGIFLSADQTGRQLYVNLSGAGGMMVDGTIADTFHSGGITSGQGTLRKAGTGILTLNGNSSYSSLTTIEAGTLKIGHANALGATGTGNGTTLTGNSTLDLNGFTTGESLTINNAGNKIVNSSAASAGISADATLNADLTVDTSGNITTARLIGSGSTRTVTKSGVGTLTTNGTSYNNLVSWNIQAGTVILANTGGYGADRSVTLNGGTLQLSGSNSDLVNNAESFTINTGTFDLNGKAEAVASIGGAGGNVTNTNAAAATLYVGGGVSGTSSASYGGTIQNGTGVLNLTKEGTGTQTLTGTNTYTGATSVNKGTLVINGDQSAATGAVTVGVGATNATAVRLSGTGTVGGNTSFAADPNATGTDVGGIHSVGDSSVNGGIGKQTFDKAGAPTTDLTYNSGSIFEWQLGATVKDSDTGGALRGTDWDAVNVTGTLSGTDAIFRVVLNGSQTFADSFWNADHQWTDIFKTGDAGSAVSFASIFGGGFQYYNSSVDPIGNTNASGRTFTISGSTLSWSAVPEPTSALAGILLGVGLLRRRRN